MTENGNYTTLSIKETNSFRGIPYADYFTVNTEWIVVSNNKENKENSECECAIKIMLDFSFLKSTWLQGTIESNTRAELLTVYDLWLCSAEEYLLNDNIIIIQNNDDSNDNFTLHSNLSHNNTINHTNNHTNNNIHDDNGHRLSPRKRSNDIESGDNRNDHYSVDCNARTSTSRISFAPIADKKIDKNRSFDHKENRNERPESAKQLPVGNS